MRLRLPSKLVILFSTLAVITGCKPETTVETLRNARSSVHSTESDGLDAPEVKLRLSNPQSLITTSVLENRVSIQWQHAQVSNEAVRAGFRVFSSNDPSTIPTLENSFFTQNTYFHLTNVPSGSVKCAWVKAVYSSTNEESELDSEWVPLEGDSASLNLGCVRTPPSQPIIQSANLIISSKTLTVNWTASTGVNEYKIFLSKKNETCAQSEASASIITKTAGSLAHTFDVTTQASDSGNYTACLRAVNVEGKSNPVAPAWASFVQYLSLSAPVSQKQTDAPNKDLITIDRISHSADNSIFKKYLRIKVPHPSTKYSFFKVFVCEGIPQSTGCNDANRFATVSDNSTQIPPTRIIYCANSGCDDAKNYSAAKNGILPPDANYFIDMYSQEDKVYYYSIQALAGVLDNGILWLDSNRTQAIPGFNMDDKIQTDSIYAVKEYDPQGGHKSVKVSWSDPGGSFRHFFRVALCAKVASDNTCSEVKKGANDVLLQRDFTVANHNYINWNNPTIEFKSGVTTELPIGQTEQPNLGLASGKYTPCIASKTRSTDTLSKLYCNANPRFTYLFKTPLYLEQGASISIPPISDRYSPLGSGVVVRKAQFFASGTNRNLTGTVQAARFPRKENSSGQETGDNQDTMEGIATEYSSGMPAFQFERALAGDCILCDKKLSYFTLKNISTGPREKGQPEPTVNIKISRVEFEYTSPTSTDPLAADVLDPFAKPSIKEIVPLSTRDFSIQWQNNDVTGIFGPTHFEVMKVLPGYMYEQLFTEQVANSDTNKLYRISDTNESEYSSNCYSIRAIHKDNVRAPSEFSDDPEEVRCVHLSSPSNPSHLAFTQADPTSGNPVTVRTPSLYNNSFTNAPYKGPYEESTSLTLPLGNNYFISKINFLWEADEGGKDTLAIIKVENSIDPEVYKATEIDGIIQAETHTSTGRPTYYGNSWDGVNALANKVTIILKCKNRQPDPLDIFNLFPDSCLQEPQADLKVYGIEVLYLPYN